MAEKTVRVCLRQESGFRTDCTAGDHTVVIDQPKMAGGTGAGPTPLDMLLLSLGGCLAAIARIIASQRRIPLAGVKVEVEGTIDTDGLLGKKTASRIGFSAIRAHVSLDAEMSRDEKEAFLAEIERRCPVSDNLQRETPVSILLAD